ncbi:MAG: alpha/beta hydrolase [Chloroflexota bacterium]|nr:alpha/beta hydrolase [Chloroflexota bacterium]
MALHVHESGRAGAPSLVFLHGVGTSGWMWQAQVASLADHHCLVPDLPGHGHSSGVPWVALADTTARVADLIRARATDGRAHVVGLSLGAYVAAQLLATEPGLVDHAVVSGLSALPFPHPRRMRAMGYLMAPFLKTNYMLRANARGLKIPEASYEQYRQSAAAMSRRAFLRIGNELLTYRLPAGLANAPCPTLVVAGEHEHELIRRSIPALVAALPRAEGRLALGLGHGWNGEAPELFTNTVRAWIADAPLPPDLLPPPAA